MNFADRLSLLDQPHIRPLAQFREQLLETLPKGSFVPHFDPIDGGAAAKTLLLLETPGRVPRTTMFTSLDNPSETSKNLLSMLTAARLKRSDVLMWNLVPWDIGSQTKVQPTKSHHHSIGTAALLGLLDLLPQLRAIVFFGSKAQVAIPEVGKVRQDLLLIESPHPSPTNLNTRPEYRNKIATALAVAFASTSST